MAEIGRWNGHIFEVSANLVRGFSELAITAGCETEEKTTDKQKYVKRKAANAVQVTLKVTLLAKLGCDVRAEMEAFLKDARAGKKDYFYVGSEKLVPAKMMLTDAATESIEINPSGFWSAVVLKLTMKQAAKFDSATSEESTKTSTKSSSYKKNSSSYKKNTGTDNPKKTVEEAKKTSKTYLVTTNFINMGNGMIVPVQKAVTVTK